MDVSLRLSRVSRAEVANDRWGRTRLRGEGGFRRKAAVGTKSSSRRGPAGDIREMKEAAN